MGGWDVEPSSARPARGPLRQGWGANQAGENREEKRALALYFAQHHFLVKDTQEAQRQGGPVSSGRVKSATVLATPGTTPDAVVRRCLEEMKDKWATQGPFTINWYTGSSLVAATLYDFKQKNHEQAYGAEAFLFPGPVNRNLESVLGDVPTKFLTESLQRHFHFSILSAYSFDMASGQAYFLFPEELSFQRACAKNAAGQKFIFVDSSKLGKRGDPVWTVRDLFEETEEIRIYTIKDGNAEFITAQFKALSAELGDMLGAPEPGHRRKKLTLFLVEPSGQDATVIPAVEEGDPQRNRACEFDPAMAAARDAAGGRRPSGAPGS